MFHKLLSKFIILLKKTLPVSFKINHKFQMSLIKKIDLIQKNFKTELASAIGNSSKINDLHNKYLSRKGLLSQLFSDLGKASSEDKPVLGQKINSLRKDIESPYIKIKGDKIYFLTESSESRKSYT